MNKSTSYRHLAAFEERHNCKMTEEDIINVINALQLYLKFEEKGEMNNTDKKSTTKRGTTSDKKVRTKNSENKGKETNNKETKRKYTKRNTQVKKTETNQDTETNTKKRTNDSSEKERVIALMNELKKMPTREDLRNNDVNIDNLMAKYGSWRKIKESLKLADKYEEIICNQLSELKKTDKLTMENCRANDIDISFLIRKYGGWKQVLKQAKIA